MVHDINDYCCFGAWFAVPVLQSWQQNYAEFCFPVLGFAALFSQCGSWQRFSCRVFYLNGTPREQLLDHDWCCSTYCLGRSWTQQAVQSQAPALTSGRVITDLYKQAQIPLKTLF